MRRYELLVLTRPVKGTDDEFNRWYDQRHLSDVLAVPGFVGARRYRVLSSDAPGGGDPPQWQYLAIYEMDCEDPHDAALAELGKRVGTELMPISNSIERAATARFVLREINSRSSR
jgi:hypothetical protein